LKNNNSNLQFSLQAAQELDYHKSFDVVFSSYALQWVKNKDSFLKRTYKSLKTYGSFVATIPLGISDALEQSIHEIVSKKEWSSYFQFFSKEWHFISDNEFKQLLLLNDFKPTIFHKVLQKVVFSSRDKFEKYVKQWLPHLIFLPSHLKETFFKQIIDKYLEIEPALEKGNIRFNFSRIDIIANNLKG
jgi:trans-aconitate methyltransferase